MKNQLTKWYATITHVAFIHPKRPIKKAHVSSLVVPFLQVDKDMLLLLLLAIADAATKKEISDSIA